MSDAIFERIASSLEKLVTHFETAVSGVVADVKTEVGKVTGKKKVAAATPATQSPASETAPSTAAPAQSASPAASGDLMTKAAEAVIDLASNYSRDAAVGILAKYKAIKVSQVAVADLPKVLAEALAAIVVAKAAKTTESLV